MSADSKPTQKSDTIVKLVLVFFISLLSFSIGTFVGKKFSDNQHKLSNMEPTKDADREVASVHGEEKKQEGSISDEEIAKLAEEFVADDKKKEDGHGAAAASEHGADTHAAEGSNDAHGNAHAAEAPHAAAAPAKTNNHGPQAAATSHDSHGASPADKASSVAESVAGGHGAAATVQQTTAEIKHPSLPREIASAPTGKFTVQVSSFASEKEATEMVGRLKEKGFHAFATQGVKDGKKWYRVGVGLFPTEKEAAAQIEELKLKAKDDIRDAFVKKLTK